MHEISCRFSVKSPFRSSISCLVVSNTYMSRNLHNIFSFLSALILCKSYCNCISRGGSVFKFSSACKAESESEFSFLWLICLFKSKQNCLQLRCVNGTVVSQTARKGAIWGSRRHYSSSNLLIHFWAIGKHLHIIWMSGCYFQKDFVYFRVCGIFLYFVKDRQIWGSDWLQGGVSVTVVSSTTSSNSDRIRRPGGRVRLDFSNNFEFRGSKKQM